MDKAAIDVEDTQGRIANEDKVEESKSSVDVDLTTDNLEDDLKLTSSRKTSTTSIDSTDSTQNDCSSITCDSESESRHPDSSSPEVQDGKMENLVSSLQSMVLGLSEQVSKISFDAGLMRETVDQLMEKNTRLTETVETLTNKNNVLERIVAESLKTSSNSEVNGLRQSFIEILDSCESFQTDFDSLSHRQMVLEGKVDGICDNFGDTKLQNQELKEEFDVLKDKFSSLSLQMQVENGRNNASVLVKNKTPGQDSHSSSGVKSGEISDLDDLEIKNNSSLLKREDAGGNAIVELNADGSSKRRRVSSTSGASDGATPISPAPPAHMIFPRPRMPPMPLVSNYGGHVYGGQIYSYGHAAVYPPATAFYRFNH